MFWSRHAIVQVSMQSAGDPRITLDCRMPYLIYPHREEDGPQLYRACGIQNVQRHCPYHCSKAVGVILSLFDAISLSCRACFTFPSSSPPLFLLYLGKRPQATAIVGGRALRWELRGITINHQLQSLNHPHMVSSPIHFFCILRGRKLVYKYLSFSSWHLSFPIYLFVLIHRFSRLPQEIQLQDSKLPLKSCLVFMPSFCRGIRYFIPGAIAIPQVSKLT